MKFIIISLASLVSSISMASGFRCSGQNYNIKLYNEVQPQAGTKNAAVLVVSSSPAGTIVVLQGSDLTAQYTPTTVTYSGMGNIRANGRYIHVSLEVVKSPVDSGPYAGKHLGHLIMNADNGTWTADLSCEAYLKN